MKYKVIRAYQDKNTQDLHKFDTNVEIKDAARAKELIDGGFIRELDNENIVDLNKEIETLKAELKTAYEVKAVAESKLADAEKVIETLKAKASKKTAE